MRPQRSSFGGPLGSGPGGWGPGGGWGAGSRQPCGPAAADLWWLLGLVFVTFSLQFFATFQPLFGYVRLTAAVWQKGFLWQLLSYGFVGFGSPGVWILLQLFMLYLFGKDVLAMVGRRTFWRLLAIGTVTAGAVAVLVDLGLSVAGLWPGRAPFLLIQGQQILLVVLVAAFAALRRNAVIYLLFVLPIEARWFVLIEVLLGFMGFLWSKDLGGFLGLTAAAGLTWMLFSGTAWRRLPRESWLRLQRWYFQLRLSLARRRRGFTVVDGGRRGPGNGHAGSAGGGDSSVRRGPWVH